MWTVHFTMRLELLDHAKSVESWPTTRSMFSLNFTRQMRPHVIPQLAITHKPSHSLPRGATQASAWARVALPRVCATSTPRKRAWVRMALPRGLACHVASTWVPGCATSARGSCGDNTPFLPFLKGLKLK